MNRLVFLLLFLLSGLTCRGEEMLVTLCQNAYAGGFDRVWVSVDVSEPSGKEQLHARSVERVPLRDSDTGAETGLWLKIRAPKPGRFMLARQDGGKVPVALFAGLKTDWLGPKVDAQRETFSMQGGSGKWEFVIGGAETGDVIRVEWVFARMGDGEREVTLTGPEGKVAFRESVGEERGARLVKTGPWKGGEPLVFRVEPTGKEWACLPNVFRVVRQNDVGTE